MTILDEKRFSITAAANLAGVHIATIWRWILSGVCGKKLRAVKIGGRRFVLERDLRIFLTAINDGNDFSEADLACRADAAGKVLDAKGVQPRGRR